MSSLERRFAEHVAASRFEDLPAEAIAAAKYSILDSVGVMLAATTAGDGCAIVNDFARDSGGREESSVFGFGGRLPAPMAALVNGALIHALDYDDVHEGAKCHPAGESFPAAFALAQRTGASGREFLTAMTVGGDIAVRIALANGLGPGSHGWLGSAIYSYFGGAAAAGRMLSLNADQMMHCFGIAFCQTGGSREMGEDGAYRGLRDGFAQKVGVMSALLAQRGLTGPSRFLEGKAGLYNQYFKGKYNRERLTEGLGEVFEGANVSYKLWPSCRLTHNYVQAILTLRDENGLKADDVERVEILVSDWGKALCEPVESRLRPATTMIAKDSMQFTLGAALAHGEVGMQTFSPEGLHDGATIASARKVGYVHDPELDPADMTPGDVRVVTKGGREIRKVVSALYATPENPIRQEDLEGKFRDCIKHAINPVDAGRVERFFEAVYNLEKLPSVDALVL